MISLPTDLDLDALVEVAKWRTFQKDSAGVDMAGLQGSSVPGFGAATREIALLRGGTVKAVMLNRLRAGALVHKHIDNFPPLERWHLPLRTNERAFWWDEEGGDIHMFCGAWWGPVPFWKLHSVRNGGSEDRYHLIVDVAAPAPAEQ